jgi:AmiR/NasT family two-component response regulator
MSGMEKDAPQRLRILIADGHGDRLEQVAKAVVSLGHEVLSREGELSNVGRATATLKPDVAIVIVGDSSDHALGMIGKIVQEAACPVIAVLDVEDRAFIKEAARRGIFAHIAGGEDPQEFQSSIDIVLQRFAEYHNLEGAFGRRALTERAKGILMERHGIDEQEAFALLRDQARSSNRKIVDIAESILSTHRLLPGTSRNPSDVGSTESDSAS